MSDLQPITGPGEYTQRNGLKAEIVGQDSKGNWLGWVKLNAEDRSIGMWRSDGSDYDSDVYDIVQPKPEIEIPERFLDVLHRHGGFAVPREEVERIARVSIEWDRANRPKREPTASDIRDCYHKCYGGRLESYSDGFRNAIRRAFELAQEPK